MAGLSKLKPSDIIRQKKNADKSSFSMSYAKDIVITELTSGVTTKAEVKDRLKELYEYIDSIY